MQSIQKISVSNSQHQNAFDAVAPTYQQVVNLGLSVTGEKLDYFARERIIFIKQCIQGTPKRVLDFGCGTGTSVPLFFELLGAKEATGIDQSLEALHIAKSKKFNAARFQSTNTYVADGTIDLAYANTVFHHIPVDARPRALKMIHDSLRPNGWLAFWENNPWNPGTRWVMSRIPFDHDAILLTASSAVKLLRENGFKVLRTDFRFIFPGQLKFLRPLEKWVQKFPIGGQYQILAKKA